MSQSKRDNFEIYRNKKKIIVALAADYGNLGDVAITFAQTKFLKDNFPTHEIIDFPISRTFTDLKALKKICTTDDIITLVGGGNTGDMYDDIEYCRQFIIQQFPDNKIISFPQTIDFSNTISGERALQKAVSTYSKHDNLILSAREIKSYETYKKFFPHNKVIFSPDVVLSLNEQSLKYEREGITLCFRKDSEKTTKLSDEEQFIKSLNKNYQVKHQDTHIDASNMTVEQREVELQNIWTVFKRSKLVITDRLHGMIFCKITGTPCIAIDNSNHKISGVYNAWLSKIENIKMIPDFNYVEIKKHIDSLMSADNHTIHHNDELYDQLKKLLD
nr:polysaccharide pyruvyl transferase family protein [uncultured Trichococcus sp.]